MDVATNVKDNEIIKALECCSSQTTEITCGNCPLFNVGRVDCYRLLANNSLDLINRQKAENDNWEKQFRILDVECSRLEKKTEEQQAEVERLQKGNDELGKAIAGAYELNCFLEATRKIVRVEAIKEFAERLKQEINIRPTHSNEQNKYVCFLINNLIKEMVGEER